MPALRSPNALGRYAGFVAIALALIASTACQSSSPTTVLVQDASVDPVRGASRLTLDADIELSEPMAEALNNGVDLVFEWHLELRRPGRFLDSTIAQDTRGLTLSYHSLSGRYLLRGLDEPRNFTDLSSLLAAVGRSSTVVGITPPDDPTSVAYWRVRAKLNRSGLPPPLRLPAWVSSGWRIQSEWFRWPQTPTA